MGEAGILFNPNDIKDMAEKMMVYIENKNLRDKKARLGFKKINGFDHIAYKEKLLKVFEY